MIRTALLSFLALASPIALANPTDKAVEKLLASLRTAYSSVDSAVLQLKSDVDMDGKTESQAVSMSYQKPNLVRLTFSFRGQIVTRVSDGKRVYTMGEKGNPFVASFSLDALGGDIPINLESLSFFDWKRQLSTSPGANMEKSKFNVIESERWNDRSWIVLEETALGQNVFVRYFIDPKTFYIWKCDVRTLKEKKPIMATEVQKLLVNVKMDPKLFSPPKR